MDGLQQVRIRNRRFAGRNFPASRGKRFQELRPIAAAFGFRHRRIGIIIDTQAMSEADVPAFPISGERRQVMRRDAHRGLLAIIARRLEAAVARPTKVEELATENIHFLHPLAEALRYGAEVFAHDQAFVALALERKNSREVLEGETDIAAVFRFSPDGSRWFELTLLEIEERAPGVFSLFLRGPHLAPQNVFQVRHDVLQVMDLFMVPIGREGDQFRYQISFN